MDQATTGSLFSVNERQHGHAVLWPPAVALRSSASCAAARCMDKLSLLSSGRHAATLSHERASGVAASPRCLSWPCQWTAAVFRPSAASEALQHSCHQHSRKRRREGCTFHRRCVPKAVNATAAATHLRLQQRDLSVRAGAGHAARACLGRPAHAAACQSLFPACSSSFPAAAPQQHGPPLRRWNSMPHSSTCGSVSPVSCSCAMHDSTRAAAAHSAGTCSTSGILQVSAAHASGASHLRHDIRGAASSARSRGAPTSAGEADADVAEVSDDDGGAQRNTVRMNRLPGGRVVSGRPSPGFVVLRSGKKITCPRCEGSGWIGGGSVGVTAACRSMFGITNSLPWAPML